jgi:hypothetical protein
MVVYRLMCSMLAQPCPYRTAQIVQRCIALKSMYA